MVNGYKGSFSRNKGKIQPGIGREMELFTPEKG
jgi:hypothetical protein